MRKNLVALSGAFIGLVAVFSTWIETPFGTIDACLIDVLDDAPLDSLAFYSALLFIVGTLVAFITQVGGFAQICGVVLWWMNYLDKVGEMPSEIASYLGLASAVVVLISMARPFGPGLMNGPFTLRDRVLVFPPGNPPQNLHDGP